MKIKSITNIGEHETFDLTVKNNHNYKTPGGVLHNCGYRGEVGVIVYNYSREPVTIHPGDRIAQGVICPVFEAVFEEVDELDETERGDGAYNSTGVK